jgi:hypothetical protein
LIQTSTKAHAAKHMAFIYSELISSNIAMRHCIK